LYRLIARTITGQPNCHIVWSLAEKTAIGLTASVSDLGTFLIRNLELSRFLLGTLKIEKVARHFAKFAMRV